MQVDFSNWLSWYRQPPAEYFKLKREWRQAKLIASAITVDGPSWSAWRRHQSRRKQHATASARRIAVRLAIMRKKFAMPHIEFWKPRPMRKADHRIGRQFRDMKATSLMFPDSPVAEVIENRRIEPIAGAGNYRFMTVPQSVAAGGFERTQYDR